MIRVLGNIAVRMSGQVHESGFVMRGHTHNFAHVTYFPRGKWEVWREFPLKGNDGAYLKDAAGEQLWVEQPHQTVNAGGHLLIEANCKHMFKLLEGPGEYHCIYSFRDPDTHEVVEEYNGWEAAFG